MSEQTIDNLLAALVRTSEQNTNVGGVRTFDPAYDQAWDAIVAQVGRIERERDEARAFLRRTAMTGGSIVSSAAMTAQQIAIAQAAGRMVVTPDGYGFVYVPGRIESDCDQSRPSCSRADPATMEGHAVVLERATELVRGPLMESDEARRTMRDTMRAFIQDRREQYLSSSGTYEAFCQLLALIDAGEDLKAAAHGELDDLLPHPTIRERDRQIEELELHIVGLESEIDALLEARAGRVGDET